MVELAPRASIRETKSAAPVAAGRFGGVPRVVWRRQVPKPPPLSSASKTDDVKDLDVRLFTDCGASPRDGQTAVDQRLHYQSFPLWATQVSGYVYSADFVSRFFL